MSCQSQVNSTLPSLKGKQLLQTCQQRRKHLHSHLTSIKLFKKHKQTLINQMLTKFL